MDLRVASPANYGPDPGVRERAEREAGKTGAKLMFTSDPARAARGAGVLYTDVWVSMGQEGDREARLREFRGYQVNEDLIAMAARDAVVMHCLPAHRGEEISAGAMDGKRSVVFEQARNRLYNAMAVLAWAIKGVKS
jgi:ornithine carbamoyltransferase